MSQDERLQRVIARAGISSRRAAEELISSGRVRVNGVRVQTLGTKVGSRDKVEVDGQRIVAESLVYLVMNKPRGVVSTLSDPEGRATVRSLIEQVGERIFPVGRLDYHTSGVLLFTNDGDFCDALIHPKRRVPKTYVVKVSGLMNEVDYRKWEQGVTIESGVTGPAEVRFLRHEAGKTWLELTIAEGRNQQIRRMGEATGFPVMRLSRTHFAGITSEGLRPGGYRPLSVDELKVLRESFGVPRKVPRGPDTFDARTTRGPERIPNRPERGPRRPERGAKREAPKWGQDRGAKREGASRGHERGAKREAPKWGQDRAAPREGASRGHERGAKREAPKWGQDRGAPREGASRGHERGAKREAPKWGQDRAAPREAPKWSPERGAKRESSANRGPERPAKRGPERGKSHPPPERQASSHHQGDARRGALTGRPPASRRKVGG
jgi:23S rRNA pseudouridine2605 synthase